MKYKGNFRTIQCCTSNPGTKFKAILNKCMQYHNRWHTRHHLFLSAEILSGQSHAFCILCSVWMITGKDKPNTHISMGSCFNSAMNEKSSVPFTEMCLYSVLTHRGWDQNSLRNFKPQADVHIKHNPSTEVVCWTDRVIDDCSLAHQ